MLCLDNRYAKFFFKLLLAYLVTVENGSGATPKRV